MIHILRFPNPKKTKSPRSKNKKEDGTFGSPTGPLPNPGWSPKKWSGPTIPVYDRPDYLPPGPDPSNWNVGDLKESKRNGKK